MNIFDQFDYEKKILDDALNVKTYDACLAILQQLKIVLQNHQIEMKNFFEKDICNIVMENHILKGNTPKRVIDIMHDFGFNESKEPASYIFMKNYEKHDQI